jgi:hypothetical protein
MRFCCEHMNVELRTDNLRHKTRLAINMSGISIVKLNKYELLVKADSIVNLIAISSSVSRDSKFSGSWAIVCQPRNCGHRNEIPPNYIWQNLDIFQLIFEVGEIYMANLKLHEHSSWMGRVVQLLALHHKHVQIAYSEIEMTC